MIDIVRRRKWFYLFTALLFVGTIVVLIAPPRLPFGLEFSSGSALTIDFLEDVDTDDVRSRIEAIPGFEESVIQRTGENSFFIRTAFVERSLVEDLEGRFGPVEIVGYEGATAIATTVTFLNPVPEQALRDAFGDDPPQDLFLGRALVEGFVVLSRDLDRDRLDEVALSWTEEFGAAEVSRFDEEGDIAETLTFEAPVGAAEVGALVDQLGLPQLVIIQGEDDLFIAAKSYPEDDRRTLFDSLEAQFGGLERVPLDYSTGQAITVRFLDALERSQVAEGVGISIANDVIGDQGALTISGDGSVLLRADSLTGAGFEDLVAEIEDELGAIERDPFNEEDDLAVTLDFGPTVVIGDFQVAVERLVTEPLRVEPAGDNAFYVAGESLAPELKEALQTGLELQFGEARKVVFDPANGLGTVVRFSETPARSEIIAQAQALGLPEVLVSFLEGDRVLIASLGIDRDLGEQVLTGLAETFGPPLERSDIDPETGILELFDYGPPVTQQALAAVVSEVTERDIFTEQEGASRFFAFGQDVPEETRNELFEELEANFGVFERTQFDFAGGKLLSFTLEDAARVEQAVNDRFTLEKTGPGQFFIAGVNIATDEQNFLFSTLRALYGDLRFAGFDFNSNSAMNLAFEQVVTVEQLKAFLDLFGYRDLVITHRPDGALFMRGPRPGDDQRSTIIGGPGRTGGGEPGNAGVLVGRRGDRPAKHPEHVLGRARGLGRHHALRLVGVPAHPQIAAVRSCRHHRPRPRRHDRARGLRPDGQVPRGRDQLAHDRRDPRRDRLQREQHHRGLRSDPGERGAERQPRVRGLGEHQPQRDLEPQPQYVADDVGGDSRGAAVRRAHHPRLHAGAPGGCARGDL